MQTQTSYRSIPLLLTLVCACLFFFTPHAHGQVADVQLSAEQTYVGMPVYLQITLNNADLDQEPAAPEIDDCEVVALGARNRSTQVVVINGRRSETSQVSYLYAITPSKPGQYVVPPLTYQVNGRSYKTVAFEFSARTSQNNGEIFVEVNLDSSVGYVGQAIDTTMQIDIKPYTDQKLGVRLSPTDMWRQIDLSSSRWGNYQSELEKMLEHRSMPAVSQVFRRSANGETEPYYRYMIPGRFIPKRAGKLDFDNVRIVMRYPTALRQARGFFSVRGELEIADVRPIIAQPQAKDVEVEPLPQANQPKWFTGSVGEFEIAADAEPEVVHVGDPIQLLLRVRGNGEMDFLHAPPIWKVDDLTRDFQVSQDPVPGIVRGDSKVFVVTIRPKHTDIKAIPALPFSFFNPNTAAYDTVWTQPIPLTVKPAERLSLDQIVSADGLGPNPAGTSTTQAPHVGVDIDRGSSVLESTGFNPSIRLWLLWLIGLPTLVCVMGLVKWLIASMAQYNFLDSDKAKLRRLQQRVNQASTILELRDVFTDMFRVIREHEHPAAYSSLKDLISLCDQSLYGKRTELTLESMKEQSRSTISLLATIHPGKPRLLPRTNPVHRTAGVIVILLSLLFTSHGYGQSLTLTAEQKQDILAEAEAAFDRGVAGLNDNVAEAIAAFQTSSERYKLLLDNGVDTASLHRNLGLAYLHAGEPGRAKAHLLKARQELGWTSDLREALSLAEARLLDANAEVRTPSSSTLATQISDLNSWFSMQTRRMAMFWSWFVLWICTGCYLVFREQLLDKLRSAFIGLIVLSMLVTLTAGMSVTWDWSRLDNSVQAVAVASSPVLREGRGSGSGKVMDSSIATGDVLKVLQQSDGWVRVETPDAQTGWLRTDEVVVIEPSEASTLF